METTLTDRGQTAVPAKIRKKLQLKSGQKLEWVVQGQVVYLTPKASDPIKQFRGSSKSSLTTALLKSRSEDAKR